jgi:hypothetical protein
MGQQAPCPAVVQPVPHAVLTVAPAAAGPASRRRGTAAAQPPLIYSKDTLEHETLSRCWRSHAAPPSMSSVARWVAVSRTVVTTVPWGSRDFRPAPVRVPPCFAGIPRAARPLFVSARSPCKSVTSSRVFSAVMTFSRAWNQRALAVCHSMGSVCLPVVWIAVSSLSMVGVSGWFMLDIVCANQDGRYRGNP